jgi:hypothetical protein
VSFTGFLRGCVVWSGLPPGAAGVAFRSYRRSTRAMRCSCAVKITEFESFRGMSGDFVVCVEGHTPETRGGISSRFRRYVWRGFG